MRSRLSKAGERFPEWLCAGIALWNLAICVTALTAIAWGRLDPALALLWKCGGKAVLFGWLWLLLRENRRLKTTPVWLAASEAFATGYEKGATQTRRIYERDAR